MKFDTETGSTYEIQGALIRRLGTHDLRGDGDWLLLVSEPTLEVGKSALLTLEPLTKYGADSYGVEDQAAIVTVRRTSAVVRIYED